MISRRSFLRQLVSAFLLAAPLDAQAQPAGKMPRLGLLADAESWEPLRQGLRDLGYVEGKTVALAIGLPPRAAARVDPPCAAPERHVRDRDDLGDRRGPTPIAASTALPTRLRWYAPQ